MNCKINFLKDKNDNKLLPFQYYNNYNLISIPILTNSKKPIIKEWQNSTKTIHPQYINENIGILTGKVNNITVIDIDVKDNGLVFWKQLLLKNNIQNFKDLNTPLVKTASGGLHYYFKYNKDLPNINKFKINNNNNKIGIDIINDKKQVIAPPSIIDNKKYKWIINLDYKIQKIPKWLKEFILKHKK
jgi:hypothetical protein